MKLENKWLFVGACIGSVLFISAIFAEVQTNQYEYNQLRSRNTDIMLRWCNDVKNMTIQSEWSCEYCAYEYFKATNKTDYPYYCGGWNSGII